jgi:hypothetical protein
LPRLGGELHFVTDPRVAATLTIGCPSPRQVIAMLDRVLAARIPFAWFTADEASGQAG